MALTFFTAPSVLIAINSDSPSGSQPEKLSVRSYPHPKLRGQLQFSDKAAQRDPAQRLKDLKARMQRKADREIAQAQPPSQPPMPFQKAVLQVAAFFSFGPRVQARPGSGALITPEGHLATNSHVIRSGRGFCAQPPVQGDVAPLIVLLVTEDLQKPPIPRYVADFVTDDPYLDIAVLKISRELKEGLNNLQELEEKVSAAGSRDAFLNQWAKEGLVRSIPIQPLTLWDSDAALVGQRVTALGYPRPDDKLRNPSLNTDDRGNIQAKPEGFLRVGAAFAAPGSSGGAVVRSEEGREYLIGIICAGEFGTGQGVALARPINAAVDGPIKAAQLTINQAPVAHFIPKPLLPRPRETVVFDALERSRDRDGSIQECQWQIKENGQSLTLPGCRLERSFPPDSRPKVTLTVRDDKGLSDVFSQEILLKVEEGPCRAKLRGPDSQLKVDLDSIQAAINQAGPGDVIEVIPPTPPRACAESVEIKGKRELTLRGARSIDEALAFVLAGDGTKPTVLITDSENITLQGLTITQGNPGVRVENSRAIRVKQSIFKANRAHGILWVNASGRVSDDSRLEGNLADLQGLFGHGLTADQKSVVDVIDTEVAENAGAGVTALGESELKLEFVQVRGNEGGLLIDGAKQVALRDVKVRANSKTGISAKKTTLIIVSSWIEDNREDGLSLTDVAAEIKENTAIARNSDGIEARGTARLILQNSRISDNKGDGLFVGDLAWVTLSNCQVSDNFYGLSIRGSARATIINSTFNNDTISMGVLSHAVISHTMMTGSRYVGILMEDASRAIISYSQISDNKQGGILMEDSAYLELHDSIIKDNKGPYSDTENIWMLDSTQATIVNSTISGSGDNGIEISDSAQVTLTNSTVSANKSHGLHVKDSAQVRLLNSTISGNKGSGIAISDQAQATIYNTTISDQHDDGTVEFPFAVGVSVRGSAKLELRDSVIKNNQDIGILLRESAEATMRDTTISANNTGISVWGSAQATIQENTIQGNKECGIWSSSDKPVRGGKNRMGDNLQGDLCGKVPPSLRIPLANQTDRIQLSVPQDYKTLQEAIDAIAPGGTITIAAGTHNVAGLTIYKDVTLQGAAEQQTIVKGGISICCKARQVQLEKLIVRESPVTGLLLSADEAMRVAISDSAISANRRHGIGVENSTQVTLQNSEISGNGHWGIYLYGSSQAMVSNTIVSRNGYDCAFLSNLGGWWGPPIWITVYICGGIEVGAKGQLELRDSTIKDNKVNGIELEQSAQATIFNTLISGNGEGGIIIDDQSQATINSTKISGNGGHGLVVGDSHVMISNTTIEGNGTSGWCNGRESFCNGIWAKSFSGVQVQLIVSDSIITNNKDWGMATWLKKCGYQDDFFAGSVIFQGRNKIEGNNKSGDQNGMGNPGNHPWNRPEVPDGQVCLP